MGFSSGFKGLKRKTNRNNNGGSVGKSLLPSRRKLRPRDPWAMQLELQQTGEGAGESPAP